MAAYLYRALHPDGAEATGQLEAPSRQEALRRLDLQGLNPLELTAAPAAASARRGLRLWPRRGVAAKVREDFIRQLSSLLAAGVPLARALHLLAYEVGSGDATQYWQGLHKDVLDGCSLAQAMERHPEAFPRVDVAMVRAGETGGFLDLVLKQIAAFQSRDRDLRGRVWGALLYPAILAVLSVAVLIFLMIFFIPRFQGIFTDFGGHLPPLTSAIVAISLGLKHYGLLALIGLTAVALVVQRWFATPAGRLWLEGAILKLPIIGDVAARFAMTRFCRMLGTLTHAGVPLINALHVARESLGNAILSGAVNDAVTRVQHGDRLGTSLATCPRLFPATVVAMITVAEQSGQLGAELVRLADDSEQELDRRLRTAVALAEPVLLFFMAAFVGTIVISMVLPIFAIQDYIK